MSAEDPDRHELLDEVRALRRELAELRAERGAGGTEELRYKAVIDHVVDGLITIDDQGRIESFNPAAARIFGYAPAEVLGRDVKMLMTEPYHSEHGQYIHRYLRTGEARIIGTGREVTGRRKDGSQFPMDLAVGEFTLGGRRKFTGSVRDISARKHLEEQLLQAQKMESVGQLAGGVAHDFNNQLGIILFDVDMLLATAVDEATRSDLLRIRKTVLRAADLTRQLLVFSRRQRMEPQVLDLNQHLTELHRMVARLLGDDVDVRLELADGPCTVRADPGNLDQVVINLCVNARDAMPEGGTLRIGTDGVLVGEEDCRHYGRGTPGRYCRLTVADDGIGMPADVKARIFEPFFTTKDMGKGTGLGLSVVYGIVEAHGGWLAVDSEPGAGTRFQIFLPAHGHPTASAAASGGPAGAAAGRNERILLIEDDPEIRERMQRILSGRGYRVTACEDLAAARRARAGGSFELIITDVVLPDGLGPEFCLDLAEGHPDLAVVVLTGYTDGRVDWDRVTRAGFPVLHKPVGVDELLESVRTKLDGS